MQNGKRSVISQLQSQVQQNDFDGVSDKQNIPESWKWENLDKVKDKKERKNKNKNKNKNKKQKQSSESNSKD